MSNVRYNLQTPSQAESYIRLVFRYDGQRLVYYPGEKIKVTWWNGKTGRLRKTADNPHWQEVNTGLDRLAALVLDTYRRYRNDGRALSPEDFRIELDAVWKNRTRPVKVRISELPDFMRVMIEERSGQARFTVGTVKTYRTTLNKLEAFAAAKRWRLTFERIDLEFQAAFVGWLTAQGFRPNYIYKLVKTVRVFMAVAAERGLHTNLAYRSRLFSVPTEDADKIALDEAEVAQLAALDLSNNPRLERVRDLFLLGCYTGLRFSDYRKIVPENMITRGLQRAVVLTTQKTRWRVVVPLFEAAEAILARYGGTAPRMISNQNMNEYLKEVGRLAGIVAPMVVEEGLGALRIEKTVERCELLSTHTARRSFATNETRRALAEGRSHKPIMDILGIRKESVFWHYVKLKPEENVFRFMDEREGRDKRAG
jgi:site-specific recombinase XerD